MNLTDVMCCGQRMEPSPSADELKCGRCGSVVAGSDVARFDRQWIALSPNSANVPMTKRNVFIEDQFGSLSSVHLSAMPKLAAQPRCECGVAKTGGNHSSWCPAAKE